MAWPGGTCTARAARLGAPSWEEAVGGGRASTIGAEGCTTRGRTARGFQWGGTAELGARGWATGGRRRRRVGRVGRGVVAGRGRSRQRLSQRRGTTGRLAFSDEMAGRTLGAGHLDHRPAPPSSFERPILRSVNLFNIQKLARFSESGERKTRRKHYCSTYNNQRRVSKSKWERKTCQSVFTPPGPFLHSGLLTVPQDSHDLGATVESRLTLVCLRRGAGTTAATGEDVPSLSG